MTTSTLTPPSAYRPLARRANARHDHGKPVAGMTERNVLFASWPVEPDLVRPLVPACLELDAFDGQTFVSTVALHMHDVHLKLLEKLPAMPGFGNFRELNLRTYVRHNDEPGIFFISIDTSSLAYGGIADFMFHLPCHHADQELFDLTDRFRFESSRHSAPARFEATYRPKGSPAPAAAGTLEHFLCERYSYFLEDDDSVVQGCIHHDPWPISDVDADCDAVLLFETAGLPAPGQPVSRFYVRELQSVAWLPHAAG